VRLHGGFLGLQRSDLLVDRIHTRLQGLHHAVNAEGASAVFVQAQGNLRQAEAQLARHGNEHHLAPHAGRVVAVAVGPAVRAGEAQPFVVAQRVDGHRGLLRKFGNLHGATLASLALREGCLGDCARSEHCVFLGQTPMGPGRQQGRCGVAFTHVVTVPVAL